MDDEEIRRVHREFLGEDRPTDVISFFYGVDRRGSTVDRYGRRLAAGGWRLAKGGRRTDERRPQPRAFLRESPAASRQPPNGPFGEIVVSAETALREARARGIEPQEELLRYAIHGLLHILGYDDRTPSERRRMRALERRYLKRLF